MQKIKLVLALLVAALFLAGGLTAQATACGPGKADNDGDKKVQAATEAPKEIVDVSVDDLASSLVSEESKPVVVDVNNPSLRESEGKIPGAILLSHYKDFDVAELPADKSNSLVFYCASQQCGASHKAALRAQTEGYDNVQVLKAGILGWKEAGQKTETVAAVVK